MLHVEYIKQLENDIADFAASAFKDHQITELLNNGMYRSWRCGKPHTIFYSFRITTIPGHLFITGDIGDLMVSRAEDMIGWCQSAVNSIEYFASKVPHSIPTTEFDIKYAEKWADQQIITNEYAITDANLQELKEYNFDESSPDDWYRFLMFDLDIDDPPRFQVYNSNFLWCRQALIWFLEHESKKNER